MYTTRRYYYSTGYRRDIISARHGSRNASFRGNNRGSALNSCIINNAGNDTCNVTSISPCTRLPGSRNVALCVPTRGSGNIMEHSIHFGKTLFESALPEYRVFYYFPFSVGVFYSLI